MRLDLTVTHAPEIKSKQPWPRLAWLGKQTRDLLLIDSDRIKVLCLNGKSATKKKIAKLQSHLGRLAASNLSPNGAYMVCLLDTGDLLIYEKDSDVLKTVPGIDQLATHKMCSSSSKTADKALGKASRGSSAPLVFISSDANNILVVIGQRQLFMWEIDQSLMLSSAKQHILKGTWSCIDCEGAKLPSAKCKETSIHATFFRDSILGACCMCSFVFNQRSNVQISSVFLHWLEPYHIHTSSQPRFTAEWSILSFPLSDLSESAEPVRHRGAYLSHHARSGQTLAIAINQRSPADTRVLFVSIMGSTVISADMKGCGCRKDNIRTGNARTYWLADIAWTPDDLFLACITKQGCLSLLSRLGEAVLIQSSGCSIIHEPGFFLPFHPLVIFIPTAKHRISSFTGQREERISPTSSLRSEADEKRQRFSLSTHPTLPLLLLSDGYLVTVMELTSGLSCTGVVRDFLSQGRTAVNLLLERQGLEGRRLRRLSALQLQRTLLRSSTFEDDPSRRTLSLHGAGPPTSTLTRDGLLSTTGSDFADYADRFSHLDEGQFVYNDPTDVEDTRIMTLKDADGVSVIADRTQKALLSAWGLAVSHTGEWSYQIEDLLQYTARTLVKLFIVMLQAVKDSEHRGEHQYISALYRVLNLFKVAITVLHWDIPRHHSLPTGYKLIRGMVKAILRHSGHQQLTTAPRYCISILKYCETLLTSVYSLTGVHQPTFCGFHPYPYHQADLVEGALMCRDSVRIRETIARDDHVTWVTMKSEEMGGSRGQRDRQEIKSRGIVVRHTPAKRLIKTWKLLHRHLAARYRKLMKDSTTRHNRGVRRVLLLLCSVQMKLKQLNCNVSVSLSDEWSKRIDACFLRGCQYYLQGYPEEAVTCWQKAVHQTKELQNNGGVRLPSNRYFSGHKYLAMRTNFPTTGSSALLSYSLLAITYTRLEQYNLVAVLSLVDSLIECYGVETREDERGRHREQAGRWNQLKKSGTSFLGWGRAERESHSQLPCVPDPVQRETVQTLARFMALYFTNHSLFVYPPCAARPLPPLHQQPVDSGTSRTVPIYHDRISSSIRQQKLSDVWTADTAMALLLICGLLPEAVWLARELGDWKSALMLSVMARQQLDTEMVSDKAKSQSQMLSLPENLTPLVIVKEGISVILQTPLTPPSPGGGSSVKRNSSFSEQDRRGSHSLGVSGGMRRSSSMCSINEEDRIMQEQLCRSLTDMLTAATIADLDPTPWLLSNLMDRCLSLVAEFNTLVPEEFYLPAPPFYCPQPDYEPKDFDPEEVLFESSLRREVNDTIQLILLVLNSAKCSLPCARWYVQQLDLLVTVEARKKKVLPTPLPSVLIDHARFPVDLLKTGIDSLSLPHCTVKLLQVFRDLCTLVWMLHSRDKLTLAVRKYQASRERSLRVKPQNNAEVAKHSELLQDILMWADNLHPFSSFLNLEEEVQDILLTAISELPPTKKTVAILARHFHGNIGNLSPILQEKFQRLTEKLKKKRELSSRKMTKKKKTTVSVVKENKRIMKYETLHQHYRHQCKLRKLHVGNRQEEIGLCELQVFDERSEITPLEEVGDKQDVGEGPGHSSGEPSTLTSKQNMQTGNGNKVKASINPNQKDTQYPHIGSREFESSLAYLDFLETFFLVAFGKIVQNSAPFSGKSKLPLIRAYSSELRQKAVSPVIRRMSGNSKPPTVELDSSSLIKLQMSSKDSKTEGLVEGTPGNINGNFEKGDEDKFIKSRSMFHQKPDPSDDSLHVISLRKHGSRSSLNSFIDYNKEKTSLSSSSLKCKAESRSKQGILQPYSTIVLHLGEAYRSKAELLQWFGRWSERQLAVYAQSSDQANNESKVILRVCLPQQLVLNCLWLARHVYHPDLFETQSAQESSVMGTTVQKESVQVDESNHARRDKRNLGKEQLEFDKHRKSKNKRASKKDYKVDTDSEEDESDEERSENAGRSQSNSTKKRMKKKSSKHPEQEKHVESVSTKPRKKRQLPQVTQAHRSTSPRYLSANKRSINQLLMRAKSPSASEESKPKSLLDENNSELSDRSDTSTSIATPQAAIRSQKDLDAVSSKKIKNKPGRRVTDASQRSKRDDIVSKSKRGIIKSDVFYYSDSDTSSTLDISSLDEAEGKTLEQENWLVDSESGFPTFLEEDPKIDVTLSQKQRDVDESPTSLNLNMKDADVKRLVREEFMRMMEKNKNTRSLTDRNLQINATSEASPLPKVSSNGREKKIGTAQREHQKPVLKETQLVQESAGRSGTSSRLSVQEGVDVETQAPSPLMQTWHGDASVPTSLHKDVLPLSSSRDVSRRDLKSTSLGPDTSLYSEQALAGLNPSRPVQSTWEAPGNKSSQNGFKPDLHSTAYDADTRLDQLVTGNGRATQRDGDEPEMSPLSLQDLEGEHVGEDSSYYAPRNIMQPGRNVEHGHPENAIFTPQNQQHGDGANRSDLPPPPTYQSAFRFAMQMPLLLTVPPENLAQGALGAAGARYPHSAQGSSSSSSSSQNIRPPVGSSGWETTQRDPATYTTARETHGNMQQQDGSSLYLLSQSRAPRSYFGYHRSTAEPQILASSALPRNAQTAPPVSNGFIPPMAPPPAFEHPVSNLVSVLHPGTSQQTQHIGGSLPPIPLLHMEPRYTAPAVPPPRYPHVPSTNRSGLAHPIQNAHSIPVNPLPLLNLQADAKPTQLVPLEELSAFERKQRQEKEKHPAVRAREARERMDGGKEEGIGPEIPAPIQLLHADLKNDLTNASRQRKRQQEKKPATKATPHTNPTDPPGVRHQSTREDARLQTEEPRPGDILPSRRQDTEQKTELMGQDEKAVSKETARIKRGTKECQERKAVKRNVILVESSQLKPGGNSKKRNVSSDVEDTESDEDEDEDEEDEDDEEEKKGKQEDAMRRGDLGSGYAIKPGSFDAILQDRDARTAIPTAAQVHYDTIQKLQAKPKARLDASVKATKNVSTSMSKDDFPHHAPTVAEATSQYTAAATGLANTGQIVAPDIFFNLRFGSSTSDQQPGLQDKDSGPATKGRSFISVVDIDLKDLPLPDPEPLHKNLQQPQTLHTPQPTHPPDDNTQAPSPSNAELHYNALFLKDAHPKRTPPKVQFEEDEEEEAGGGPDAVTMKVLDRKIRANSRQVAQSRARSESARQSTKEKLSERLAQMNQQLNAIEESAVNIQEDFRNTSLMLHTVENLADAMAPGDTRPKADYSFRDYREPNHTGGNLKDGTGELIKALKPDDTIRSQESRPAEVMQQDDEDEDREVYMVTEEEENLTGFDRGEDTALTLGISGISGVSDIIAEVIAEGNASDARKMGISTRQRKAARIKIEQRRVTEKHDPLDYVRLSSDKIRELLETPRTARDDSEEGDRWPSRRKAAERSEEERKELQQWAAKKRTRSLAEYKKQRGVMIEMEHKPYRPKGSDVAGLSSLKEIRKQEEGRDKKKKGMVEASHGERVQLAKALMAEIFTEKPQLPPADAHSPSTTRRKDRALRETEGAGSRLDASGLSSRPDRWPDSKTQRTTYMFVDSGAYRPRPMAGSHGVVAGRVDSRSSRGEELGYSLQSEQRELGRWTGGMQSAGRGSTGQVSRRRKEFEEYGQEMGDDWLEGISEIGDDEKDEEDLMNKTEQTRLYRPKPFNQLVKVQRPEVTRKHPGSAGTQKTYTEMLQEMKGETNKKQSSSQTLKAKQRLYGTRRIPGSSKAPDSTTPRVTKTYSERLSDMQQKSGGQTRLRPRTRPRGVPRINTAIVAFGDDPHRRQQVERRGLHSEQTPRSSTPYHEKQNPLLLSGTYRARDDVVSPAPKVGVKYKPKDSAPITYVERLQRASLEAPRTRRHRTAYVGATPRGTYKSPHLHMPLTRHRPYPSQDQRSPGVDELDDRSGLSDLSSWNVSDEVKNILLRRDSYEGELGGMTDDDIGIDGLEYDDYTAAVDIKELKEIASVSSGSILSNIDWGAVDRMIADVH